MSRLCQCPSSGEWYCQPCATLAARAGLALPTQASPRMGAKAPGRAIKSSRAQDVPQGIVTDKTSHAAPREPQCPLIACLPLRLVSESNQREHWARKHQRAKDQRYSVYYNLRCSRWLVPPLPLTITMTRIAPRLLDSDNLVGSFKACQDGVADWLAGTDGKGQDRQEGLTWGYEQQQGKPREYSLLITIVRTS